MKKIYMVSFIIAMLFMLPAYNLIAQSNLASCFGSPSTAPNARVFHLKGFNSPGPLINTLSFTDIPVGTTIRVYSSASPGAPPLVTYIILPADNGKFIWSYPNNTANAPVVMCVAPLAGSCCPKAVPTLSDCVTAGGPPVNFKPFVDGGQCRMLIQVNIGEAIQLLDATGQVIPNVVEVQPRAFIGGGKEIACVSYPCGTTIGSITACGAVNCCSAPFVAEGPLPIILIDFKASLDQQGKAFLNWSSAIEINSKSYIIEKGTNGRDFSAVGEVASSGSGAATINYSFADKNAISGRTYYRLKMLDTDGKFEYSKVVAVNAKIGNGVTAGPNPFTNSIQLYGMPSAELSKKNIQVLNAVGQQISYTVTGANTITLDEAAPKGVYIVKVKDQQFKMLKQ
jgi:Secretion system C-terminal sorting domain